MKFKELEECPFCGHDTFYTVQYVYGSLHYRERFDGEESENGEMYDGLNCAKFSGRAYCDRCHSYIGNVETNELAKGAEKAVKYNEQRRF